MLRKFKLADDFGDFYRDNGYVIITDLLEQRDLESARAEIFALFRMFFNNQNSDLAGGELMAFYYKHEKENWRQCAKRMYDLLSVYRLAANQRIEQALRKMGMGAPMISSRPEVRTDMPEDEQYTQPWHQDWRYGQGSVNAVTFWVPLQDVDPSNGTIEISPQSHLLGYLPTEELPNPRRFSITDPRVNELPSAPVLLRFGEAVAFSQMIVHRSGYNHTKSPRVTVQMRFSDYADPLFLENRLPTPLSSSELLWSEPPSAEDVKRQFQVNC